MQLAFITDHTSVLMAASNLAQSDGPVACFMYDKMKDVLGGSFAAEDIASGLRRS